MLDSLATLTPGVFFQFLMTTRGEIRFIKISKRFEQLTGIKITHLLADANALFNYSCESNRLKIIKDIKLSAEFMTALCFCIDIKTTTTQELWFEARSMPELRSNSDVVWTGFAYDVTLREHAINELATHLDLIRNILDNMLDAVVNIDKFGKIIFVNKTASTLFGYTEQDLAGKNVSCLMSNHHAIHHNNYLKIHDETHENRIIGSNRIVEAKQKDGTIIPVELRVCKFNYGQENTFIGVIRDLRYKAAHQEDIDRLTLIDPLTDMPNRNALIRKLNECIDSLVLRKTQFCLACFDVDDFKKINEGYGFEHGDEYLRQVANSIKNMHHNSFVAKTGEDEFSLVFECDYDFNKTKSRVETLLRKISVVQEVFGLKIACSFTAGAFCFDTADLTSSDIIRKTELALHHAKTTGRGSCEFHDSKIDDDKRQYAHLDQWLKNTNVSDDFYLVYQPQHDIKGRIYGFEALMRWEHNGSLISPDIFIPMAERNGSIYKLGCWLLKQACMFIKHLESIPLLRDCRVSINISPLQFARTSFVNEVMQAISICSISPTKLHLELTERLLLESAVDVAKKLRILENEGLTFSLDDFGTGYSSLAYIKKLPLHELKIDKSFIQDLNSCESDRSIVSAILKMAEGLKLNVIAEGVETIIQKDILVDLGCNKFQGYLFGKPQTREFWLKIE